MTSQPPKTVKSMKVSIQTSKAFTVVPPVPVKTQENSDAKKSDQNTEN
jgi:hypothetical protein